MPVCRKPMSGWQETMFSPSNSSRRRSTPWVEGCCGPMLRTMRRPPVGDCSSSTSATDNPGTAGSLILSPRPHDGVILAQRMPFPIVRQHDAAQVGMVEEADAKEVEHFALVPVGAAPDSGDGIDYGIRTSEAALETQALVTLDAVQVIDDFETRFGGMAVHRGDRADADELLIVLEKSANAGDFGRSDLQRQLAMFALAALDRIGIEGINSQGSGMLFQMIG